MTQTPKAQPARARVRVKAGSSPTRDSFQNLSARMGMGAANLAAQGGYALNPITRNRMTLEFAYRGSWVVRQAVDIPADDMTREGLVFEKGLQPTESERMLADMSELGVMGALAETIKWARLYGGACGFIMIDGQDASSPLAIDKIQTGAFRGIIPFDRWQLQTSLGAVVTEPGPDLGKPEFYEVTSNSNILVGKRIHHSRMLRVEGDPLPYWQRLAEMGWGASVLEAIYDRLTMFDSTSTGMAQLVYRAHLRTLSIEGLRNAIIQGGKAMDGVAAQLDWMRQMQGIEGMTILDGKDKFDAHSYTFSGLDSVLLQAAQQLAGALQIPLVRLFGQSPAGLNSTGESDLRTYYDGIKTKQTRLRRLFSRLARIVHFSTLGRAPTAEFDFGFKPLYELSAKEKSDIAVSTTSAISTALNDGTIDAPTAMRELRQSSEITGVFTNITDEAIEAAAVEPPPGAREVLDRILASDPAAPAQPDDGPRAPALVPPPREAA